MRRESFCGEKKETEYVGMEKDRTGDQHQKSTKLDIRFVMWDQVLSGKLLHYPNHIHPPE